MKRRDYSSRRTLQLSTTHSAVSDRIREKRGRASEREADVHAADLIDTTCLSEDVSESYRQCEVSDAIIWSIFFITLSIWL